MLNHNSLLGWIEGFKFSKSNSIIGGEQIGAAPYPVIIPDPSIKQCWQNWNWADTGMLFSTMALSTMFAVRLQRKFPIHHVFERRREFLQIISMSFVFGIMLGLRNSAYRLEGLVPNGLEAREFSSVPRKYDYTTRFLKGSLWGSIFADKESS